MYIHVVVYWLAILERQMGMLHTLRYIWMVL